MVVIKVEEVFVASNLSLGQSEVNLAWADDSSKDDDRESKEKGKWECQLLLSSKVSPATSTLIFTGLPVLEVDEELSNFKLFKTIGKVDGRVLVGSGWLLSRWWREIVMSGDGGSQVDREQSRWVLLRIDLLLAWRLASALDRRCQGADREMRSILRTS
jgi:hypothetical protein